MIEVINETDAITGKILKIIKEAKETVFIVSPYLQTWDRLQNALDYKLGKGVNVTIITRKTKKGESSSEIQSPFDKCEINLLPNLHSKIYFNEDQGLITSMNMYGHSAKKNYEIGVYFPSGSDQLSDIKNNIDYLIDRAEPYISQDKVEKEQEDKEGSSKVRFKVISKGWKWTKVETPEGYEDKILNENAPNLVKGAEYEAHAEKKWENTQWGTNVELINITELKQIQDTQDTLGFCIICKEQVPYNIDKPLCKTCYFEKQEYRGNIFGKHCHKCGKYASKITDYKPLCFNCFKGEKSLK